MISNEITVDLMDIVHNFDGVLLDAYGVFWGGNAYGVLPGSKEVMETLVSHGKIVGILSNSTQLTATEKSKFERHGIVQGEHFHFLLTSGEVARAVFIDNKLPFPTPRNTFWLFGDVHPKFSSHEAIFQNSPYRETKDIGKADFVYISIPHIHGEDQVDIEVFRESIEKIPRSLPMVCVNPDLYAHEGNPPRAVVRQGSIAQMYQEMGGYIWYIGKPHSEVYIAAKQQFCSHGISEHAKVLMIGDTPETDIRGAHQCKMASALTIQTGIIADRIARKGSKNVFEALPITDIPNYFIKRFSL